MKARWKTLVRGLAIVSAAASCQRAGWALVDQLIADDVPTISTVELAAALEEAPTPLLLDVRTAEEFAVSHLPGAIHFPPGAPIADEIRNAESVVAYCSVGVRSGIEAERLSRAGISDVKNLEGSIFRWAIEGRPLVNAAGATDRVHPYDRGWGQLLPARLRSVEPPEPPEPRDP